MDRNELNVSLPLRQILKMASDAELQLEFDKLGLEYFRIRVLNVMRRSGFVTLGDLRTTSDWYLLQQKQFGETSLRGLKAGVVNVIKSAPLDPGEEETAKESNLVSNLITWSEGLKYRDREIFRHKLGLTTATGGTKFQADLGTAPGVVGSPKTLDFIGKIFNFSRERIRQLFNRIMKKALRAPWGVELNERVASLVQSEGMLRVSNVTDLDDWFRGLEKAPQVMKELVNNLSSSVRCAKNPFFGYELAISTFGQQDLDLIYSYLQQNIGNQECVSHKWRKEITEALQCRGIRIDLHQVSKLLRCFKRELDKHSPKIEPETFLGDGAAAIETECLEVLADREQEIPRVRQQHSDPKQGNECPDDLIGLCGECETSLLAQAKYCHMCGVRVVVTPDPVPLSDGEILEASGLLGLTLSGRGLVDIKNECKEMLPKHLVFIQCGFFWNVFGFDAVKCSKLFGWKLYGKSDSITGIGMCSASLRFRELQDMGLPYCLLRQVPEETSRTVRERFIQDIFPRSEPQDTLGGNVAEWDHRHISDFDFRRGTGEEKEIDPDKILTRDYGEEDWHGKWVARVKKVYSNAWGPWSDTEEDELLKLLSDGLSVRDISEKMGRTPGAIRSRANKLDLEF